MDLLDDKMGRSPSAGDAWKVRSLTLKRMYGVCQCIAPLFNIACQTPYTVKVPTHATKEQRFITEE